MHLSLKNIVWGLYKRNSEYHPELYKSIENAGGKIVVPKMPIPSYGWLAYFTDLDGNIHGIMQEDKNAK
ncbi:MAG: hypothetical protein ABI723_08750 [Bacteroidia bacterium]